MLSVWTVPFCPQRKGKISAGGVEGVQVYILPRLKQHALATYTVYIIYTVCNFSVVVKHVFVAVHFDVYRGPSGIGLAYVVGVGRCESVGFPKQVKVWIPKVSSVVLQLRKYQRVAGVLYRERDVTRHRNTV